jgi:hypothetical protein
LASAIILALHSEESSGHYFGFVMADGVVFSLVFVIVVVVVVAVIVVVVVAVVVIVVGIHR